ncbi:site-2 protease family protein [Archangium lansingense]|uniref:Site-2 protease family protein n=1 Tax=Archangium lansingense TaxID=2995310 RepID=A0ABT4APR2_9BACT|nr:site-2 protease family protein [Archangium lansinium]MCY1083688.1 site-2 protease family protein [Archangium lansinium]
MDSNPLLQRALMLIPLVLSLSVHEFAHAWSAWRLGDDTAERQGRLTLNPMAHIDPIGTLLLPLLGIPFGWARPVPVDPTRFRRDVTMRTGMMITAAAGPISNLILAALSALIYGITFRINPSFLPTNPGLEFFLQIMLVANVGLAIFNLLPVPPLDGSRIVEGLLPYRLQGHWQKVLALGPLLLLAVVFFGRGLISGPTRYVVGLLHQFIATVALIGT